MDNLTHDCAVAILRDRELVLMCHRHPRREWVPDVWDFPGGHVEPTETHQQALVRELNEELGIVIDPLRREPDEVLNVESQSTRLSVWIIDYDGPVENRAPDEHDEIRWVTADDAARLRLADPAYLPLIEHLLRRS